MNSFVEVIDRWPSLQALADDLDVEYVTAQVMRHRNSIAATHWQTLVERARRRRIGGVTLELLARLKSSARRVA